MGAAPWKLSGSYATTHQTATANPIANAVPVMIFGKCTCLPNSMLAILKNCMKTSAEGVLTDLAVGARRIPAIIMLLSVVSG